MKETKILSTGKIDILVLTREDYESKAYIKNLANDLYANLSEFNDNIYWVQSIQPFNAYSALDVLNEYTSTFGDDKLLFALAGALDPNVAASGDIEDIIMVIDEQITTLFNAKFYNIIFNRKMGRTYGNSMIFIYNNAASKSFIDVNTGDVTSGKIINRIITHRTDNK